MSRYLAIDADELNLIVSALESRMINTEIVAKDLKALIAKATPTVDGAKVALMRQEIASYGHCRCGSLPAKSVHVCRHCELKA